jgi:23S rRNA (adenine2030-N6)-methyltransferase
MLAYRHGFHAGNHADVLKHAVLVAILQHLVSKATPFACIDTHAGAGGYALAGRQAATTGEHRDGITAIWDRDKLPPLLAQYVSIVKQFNVGRRLEQYPGSPAIAAALMRGGDSLLLHELHPTDERILRGFVAQLAPDAVSASVVLGDGFAHLPKALPPRTRRGLVIIDPSYEHRGDYPKTVAALRDGLRRFATGTFLVWYPRLRTLDSRELPRRLVAAGGAASKGWLHAWLDLHATDARGFGMAGSGVVVINPPHTLAAALRESLPVLVDLLGRKGDATCGIDEGQGEPVARQAAPRRGAPS